MDDPHGFLHRFAEVNGMRIHYVEEGEGPLVVLVHGIPYLWYMWRRQIRALAAAGYRVVAPDIRGFGRSGCPEQVQDCNVFDAVGDLVGLMGGLGETSAVVVGHDLGSFVAHAAAQLRPDLFHALAMLNTPVPPREPCRPSENWKKLEAETGTRFYQHYFQTPGEAERHMDADVRTTLRSIYYSVPGSAVGEERWRQFVAEGENFLDTVFDPEFLPGWLPEIALDYYVSEYSRTGFGPALNFYRNRDRIWEQSSFLDGLKLQQPSLFIGGAADPALDRFAPLYDRLESHLPNLRRKALLEGVGHSAAEEQPELVTGMLLAFLADL
ncbi:MULTISPECIES: alpha/beta fold hydrolase [unclassified Rhodococcus (in: high G+C Gram-positive bacteria)]|uniref:alpha/beta fold hydrolase n=1 Tax=Rhodococcus TaxID=1827 RepID=UPI001E302793|nr:MULTISPECIES: alpha/beta hydrolase [unclassified Rhodococcus (in: high G+C Gram-positive bacteria)]